jgi:RimJ/RimL family protein N-acetyltransferase
MYAMLSLAFDEKKMHRVTFTTEMNNTPMRGWLEKLAGATHESTFREAWANIDGSYSDVAGYSILEHEWRGGVKERLRKRIMERSGQD